MSLYSYTLPIEKHQAAILKTIKENRNIIIKGPTGCGKSTFIPFLLKDKRVAIIEPRRIAVTSLYNTLSSIIENVGYKMRFNKVLNEKTTMTIFTDGSFLNCIQDLNYDYIIVDEVHERSVRTDLILSILKANYRNKLILMSATLDTTKIGNFFKAFTYEVPGDSNPIDIKYLDSPTSDYINESYLTVKRILKTRSSDEKKDILVFLPGEEDINDLYKICKKIPSILTTKVHSTMGDKEQMKIYEESPLTKVILSTNICETSLTIPNIKYVIDAGLFKNKIFDGISFLGIQPISRDSAIQRMGRCNRLGPGVCYKLYTATQPLSVYLPEILRSDLTSFFLFVINMKKNILNLDLIDSPPIKNVILALEFLISKACVQIFYEGSKFDSFESLEKSLTEKFTTFIDPSVIIKNTTFKTTNYGRKLVSHPFEVDLAHFYEQCVDSKVGYYGSIIVSLISQQNYNFLDGQSEKISDILYLIDLFEAYQAAQDKQDFTFKKGIPFKGLDIATKIFKTLNSSKDGDLDLVQRIFSRCFAHNLCVRNNDGAYTMVRNNQQLFIHPSSGFFKRKDPKIVVVDLFCSTKVYSRIVGKFF